MVRYHDYLLPLWGDGRAAAARAEGDADEPADFSKTEKNISLFFYCAASHTITLTSARFGRVEYAEGDMLSPLDQTLSLSLPVSVSVSVFTSQC